jgi:hypothetical protein
MANLSTHPYARYSAIHTFLFHPLYEKKTSETILSVVTNIFMTVVTGGLWIIPFSIINRMDQKKLTVWKQEQATQVAGAVSHVLGNVSSPRPDKSSPPKPEITDLPLNNTQLEPLPKLRNLPNSDEWMNSQPIEPFVRDNTQIHSIAEFIQSPVFDTSLLRLPLQSWFTPGSASESVQKELADPSNKEQIEAITKRIQELDSAVQLEERIKRIGCPNLILADLFCDWKLSPLPFALMMDEELGELKVSDVLGHIEPRFERFTYGIFSPRFARADISKRMMKIAQQQKQIPDNATFSKENVGEIRLIDICRLDIATVKRLAPALPDFLFTLLPLPVISALDSKILSARHVFTLIQCSRTRAALSGQQIAPVFEKSFLGDMGKFFEDLTDNQILSVLELEKFPSHEFSNIFSVVGSRKKTLQPSGTELTYSRTKTLLQQFSTELIYKYCRQFEADHWSCLREEQIINLDPLKVASLLSYTPFLDWPLREEDGAARFLPLLSTDQIYMIHENFAAKHWSALRDEQIERLDFSKICIPTDESTFRAIFDRPIATKILRQLPVDKVSQLSPLFKEQHWALLRDNQIIESHTLHKILPSRSERSKDLLQKAIVSGEIYNILGKFQPEHWSLLRDEQILGLDFTKVDRSAQETLFDSDRERTSRLLQGLANSGKIYNMKLSPKDWETLREEQFLKLDLSKIDEYNFRSLFSGRKGKLFPMLSSDHIYAIHKYFGVSHWLALSDAQIASLDFSKITLPDNHDQKFLAIFNRPNGATIIQNLPVDKIYGLHWYFRDEDWASLNDSQLRQIDFCKLIGRKIKFDKIVGSSPERKLMLSQKLIESGQIYELFETCYPWAWSFLSDKQIHQIDTSRVNKAIWKQILANR